MKTRLMTLIFTGLLASSMLSGAASAQDVPGHPRVNEVDQRLENQQQRIDNGVKDGQMSQGEAARDEKRDAKVERQLSRDEAKNGGHITKAEQRHMNRELNHDSHKIHRQRHGHRAHPDVK